MGRKFETLGTTMADRFANGSGAGLLKPIGSKLVIEKTAEISDNKEVGVKLDDPNNVYVDDDMLDDEDDD